MRALPYLLALLWLTAIASLFTVASSKELIESMMSKEVRFALWLSIVTSLLSTVIVMGLALPTAFSLSRNKSFVEPLLILPNAMPPVAVGATLLLFFSRTPIGSAINSLIHAVFDVPGIIVAQTVVSFPLALKPLKNAFKNIDEDIVLMLKSHGCVGLCMLRTLFKGIKGTFKSSALLVFSRSMAEFGASVTLAGAIRFKTETLPIAIYLNLASGDIAKVISLIIISISVALLIISLGSGWEGVEG